MLAFELLLSHLEKALNHALSHDLSWEDYAQKLEGARILCHVTQLDKHVYLHVQSGYVAMQTSGPAENDLTIAATPRALLEMAETKRANKNIHLSGNAEMAQLIQQFLQVANIDWEGMMADKLGDVPAHTLAQGLNKAKNIFTTLRRNFIDDTADYLVDESNLLITRQEADDFTDAVTTLRYDVDRLAARIQYLKERS